MLRFVTSAIFMLALLGGCAPRGSVTLVPEAAATGTVQPIMLATTRDARGGRSEVLRFGRYDISVPPDRAAGDIRYPSAGQPPDPSRDFLTTARFGYSGPDAFSAALRQALQARPRGTGDIVIFVHGYNVNFAEGLYRTAQMAHDLEIPATTLHFSWPSLAEPLAYAADRESVLVSRDALVQTLQLATRAGAERVILVGHSMGSVLVMESLRQLALSGDRATLNGLGGVVLLSPDLDVDLFRAQARAIGKLPQPMLIFTSKQDRALRLSARLTADSVRLGTLSDPSRLADLEVTLVEIGAFDVGLGHFNAATSPALLRILARIADLDEVFSEDVASRVGVFEGAALTVENAARVVLRSDRGAP